MSGVLFINATSSRNYVYNSVHPDQTPRCAASDLRMHCLPISRFRRGSAQAGLSINVQHAYFMLTALMIYLIPNIGITVDRKRHC